MIEACEPVHWGKITDGPNHDDRLGRCIFKNSKIFKTSCTGWNIGIRMIPFELKQLGYQAKDIDLNGGFLKISENTTHFDQINEWS